MKPITYVYRFQYDGEEELCEFTTLGLLYADRRATEKVRELRTVGGYKDVTFQGPIRFSGDVYGKSRFMLGKAIFLTENRPSGVPADVMGKLKDKWYVHLSNNEVRLIGSWPHGQLCVGRDEGKLIEVFLLENEAEFVRFL